MDRQALIGPQLPGESGLPARIRFHQAWYRARVLGASNWGKTRAGRELGSILSDESAAHWQNFCSVQAKDVYVARRSAGWGVEPIRCTAYMTSSQALTINLFAPLLVNPSWLLSTLSLVLDRNDLIAVHSAEIEYAPRRRSNYLNDMTRVDVLVIVETKSGLDCVVVEVKYGDRFNSRSLDVAKSPAYQQLASDTGLWKESQIALATRGTNQLLRVHALAAAVMRRDHSVPTLPTLLVLHHPDDAGAISSTQAYAGLLEDVRLSQPRSLAEFIDYARSAAASAADQGAMTTVESRYLEFANSDAAWMKHKRSALRAS